MLFKKRKLSNLSHLIYKEAMSSTKILYQSLTRDNIWEISNILSFTITSFTYHCFYYRIILRSKYSEEDVNSILTNCMHNMISSITNNTIEKNNLVDKCNNMFYYLDILTEEILNCNEDEKYITITNRAKYFIANVDGGRPSEVTNALAVLTITSYFTDLLTNSNFLLK